MRQCRRNSTNSGDSQPLQEGARAIRNDALHHVRRHMNRFAIAETQGNLLTIARGTPLHARAIRNDDNTLLTDTETGSFPIHPRHPDAPAPRIAFMIRTTAQNDIIQRLRTILGTPPGTRPGEIESFIRNPVIARAAQEAAQEASGNITQNPAAQWRRALSSLVGEGEIRRTLNTFGHTATLGQIGFANHPSIREARRQSPNMTLLWALCQNPRNPIPSTPEIIQTARDHLTSHIRSLTNGTMYGPPLPEQAWRAFLKLDHMALARFPNPHGYAMLTIIAPGTGTTPSPQAVRAILGAPGGPASLHPRDVTAFLQDDQRAGREERRTIARQFSALAKRATKSTQGPQVENRDFLTIARDFLTIARDFTREEDIPAWTEIASAIQPPLPKPKNPEPENPRRRTRKPLSKKDAMEILEGPAGKEILQAIGQAVRVRHQPGEQTALIHQGRTIIAVTRSPEGSLQIQDHRSWADNLHIPNPRGEDPQWSSLGIGMDAALEAGMKILRDFCSERAPMGAPIQDTGLDTRPVSLSERRAREALIQFLDRNTGDIDQHLSDRLLWGVQSLVDPEAWYLARRELDQPVTQDRYNTALGAIPHLQHLAGTNPGALEWALAHAQPTEEIHHPGQIIDLARESIFQNGLDPRHWRCAATLPRKIVRDICNAATPQGAAKILDTIAHARAVPSNIISTAVLETITRDQKAARRDQDNAMRFQFQLQTLEPEGAGEDQEYKQQRQKLRLDNQHRTISLLFRESARLSREDPGEKSQRQLARQLPGIRDYLNSRNAAQISIKSTTWRGLTRAAQAWHREMETISSQRRWQDILERRDGQYLAWTTPLDETSAGGLAIIPLRSEHDLYQESLAMLHCVIIYGDRCARGESCILSIREDGERVATGEINLTSEGWRESQTTTRRNHQAPSEFIQAVRKAAELCNQAPQPSPNRSWLVSARTGERAEP